MGLRIWASLGNGGLSHKGYKIQYLQQLQSPPEDLCEQLEKVYIDLGDRYFQVGKSLQIMEKVKLLLFIVNNMDVFAWSPYEALGVDPVYMPSAKCGSQPPTMEAKASQVLGYPC